MNNIFNGPVADELLDFLRFKRSLGYGYMRAEFTLREFDRFLIEYVARNHRWRLDQAAIAWLSSKPGRKAVSVSDDAAVLRQFFRYLRRSSNSGTVSEPIWPHLPTESDFVPYFLSEKDILTLLRLSADLKRPPFRAALYRTLILILYCTGIRFGEALRLRMRDVDTRSAVLYVDTFKGRARGVQIDQAVVVDGRFRPGGHDHLGVVGDIREDGLDNPPPPTLFVPTAQLDNEFTQLMNKVVATSFVVRTKPAPMSVAAEVQREVSAAGGDVAAFDFRPMESVLAGSIVRQRFNMLLLGTFAGMALTLSALGLYGVISYAVARRTHEVGIRMALGAAHADVLRLIVGQGMKVVAIGLALGIGLALLSTRLISRLLYGARPTDAATLGIASLGLVVVAFLATYIPARRAMRVDPMVALRYE